MADSDDDDDDDLDLHEVVIAGAMADEVLGGDDEEGTRPAGPIGPATRVDTPEGPVYVGTDGAEEPVRPTGPPGRGCGCGCGRRCGCLAVLLLFLLAGLFQTLCRPAR